MHSHPRIAIVGGGPGGLTLALLLHRQGLPSFVFERERHAGERPQGGTLDLHEGSGLLALEQAGLMSAFRALARYEDQGTRQYDKHGHLLFDHNPGAEGERPEIDRSSLRAMLLDALPQDIVRWGRNLREIENHGDGHWNLVFDDGVEGPFDLVVGADGSWSRIRSGLSPYKPQYSGVCFVEFGIDDVDRAHPALATLVGRGKMGVEGDGKGLIVQRNGNSHFRGYAIFRVPVDWAQKRFDPSSPQTVRDGLVREFAGYDEVFLDLFRASGDRFAVLPIHALPVGHCWPHRKGLTLLGDAAHVMSPFGGEGVNNAMHDALELSRALMSDTDLDNAVATYETAMFVRVVPSAEDAAISIATLLSHDPGAHPM